MSYPTLTLLQYQSLPSKRKEAFDAWLRNEALMDKMIYEATINAKTMQVLAQCYKYIYEGSKVAGVTEIEVTFPISTLPPEGVFS